MARRVADLYDRVRHLGPELVKFGIVGGIGTIVDLGGAAALHSKDHFGPLTAKAISISVAAVLTYLGSRYWTFRHRENQPLLREGGLFVGLNVIGLLIAEGVIAFTTYILGYKDPIAYNLASLAGTGFGTIFRFFAYRKWVFLAPAAPPEPAVPAFAGYPPWEAGWEPEERAGWGPEERAGWEPEGWEQAEPAQWGPAQVPAYSVRPVQHPRQVRLSNSLIPNGAVVTPMVTTTAPAWSNAPSAPVSQDWSGAPRVQASAAWSNAPSAPVSPAARSSAPVSPTGSAPRPAPAGSRAPGRHRKHR